VISCRDLRVHAAHRELLHVPELDVPAGTVLAVLGPNGAGKTTLLRALGLLGPHRITGDVLLDGKPATRAHLRTAAAAVLQRPILRRGTVADNVTTGLRFHRLARAAAWDRAAPWLDRLGIAHLADRDARTLSGGEAQRTCLARALAVEPRVLLLDEPFTGLDAPSAERLEALLERLAGEGRGVLIATHDVEQARRWDRVLCLNRLQVAFGPPEETLTREVLERTYGGEMFELPDGGAAVMPPHHGC
jgi:tungstate transport system ATP-binding protein